MVRCHVVIVPTLERPSHVKGIYNILQVCLHLLFMFYSSVLSASSFAHAAHDGLVHHFFLDNCVIIYANQLSALRPSGTLSKNVSLPRNMALAPMAIHWEVVVVKNAY